MAASTSCSKVSREIVAGATTRRRGRVAEAYEAKYGPHFASPDGTWAGLGDTIRGAEIPVYRVAPVTVFGFGKGPVYSQTRWSFS